jgi:chromosome partitioning protein
MSHVPVVAFFSTHGSAGNTSLVYHLAWMLAEQDVNVLAVDLDPQSNLTAAFLEEDELEALMDPRYATVFSAVEPLIIGIGDVKVGKARQISDGLHLLPGDPRLMFFEDSLSEAWPASVPGNSQALGITTAFHRVMQATAQESAARLILVDVDSHLGALNRSILIAADYIVLPIVPDLFSIRGLKHFGPALEVWRKDWHRRLDRSGPADGALPPGTMRPIGYIVQRGAVRLNRPAQAFARWMNQIPIEYAASVLRELPKTSSVTTDPECLAILKNYHSLVPLAQDARKPMFFLKPADGAVGGHAAAVNDAYLDYKRLASRIAERAGIAIPA